MQIVGPLSKFYWNHSSDIEALEQEDHSQTFNAPLIIDAIAAQATWVKKYFPKLDRNGLIDDFVVMLREMFAPPAPMTPEQSDQQT